MVYENLQGNGKKDSKLKQQFKLYMTKATPILITYFGKELTDEQKKPFQRELIKTLKQKPNLSPNELEEFARDYAIRVKSIASGLPMSDETTAVKKQDPNILSDLIKDEEDEAGFLKEPEVPLSDQDIETILSTYRGLPHPDYNPLKEGEIVQKVKQRIKEIGFEATIKKRLSGVTKEVVYGPTYVAKPSLEKITKKEEDKTSAYTESEIGPSETKVIEAEDISGTAGSAFFKIKILKPTGDMIQDLALEIMVNQGSTLKKGEKYKITKDILIEARKIAYKHAEELGIPINVIDKNAQQAIEEYELQPNYSIEELNIATHKIIDMCGEVLTEDTDFIPVKEKLEKKYPFDLPLDDTSLQNVGFEYIKAEKNIPRKPKSKKREKIQEGGEKMQEETPRSPVTQKKYKVTRPITISRNKLYAIVGGTAAALILSITGAYFGLRKEKPQYILSTETGEIVVSDIVDKKLEEFDKLQRSENQNQYDRIKNVEHNQQILATGVNSLEKRVEKQSEKLEQKDKKDLEVDNKLADYNKRLETTNRKVDASLALEKATAQDITKLFGKRGSLTNLANLNKRVEKVEQEQENVREDIKQDIKEYKKALSDEYVKKFAEEFKKLEKERQAKEETPFEPPKKEPKEVIEIPEEKIKEPKKEHIATAKKRENLKSKLRKKLSELRKR